MISIGCFDLKIKNALLFFLNPLKYVFCVRNLSNVCFAVLKCIFCSFLKQFMMERNLSNVLFVVLFHFEGNKPLKCAFCGFLKQFMMERILSNICFAVFTANLLKRVLWNSAWSHSLHTITLTICGFRNLRYFARSQNQQIAGFYCISFFSNQLGWAIKNGSRLIWKHHRA